jgi:hypothetical protein
MPLFNLVARPYYHKNGTQLVGKVFCKLIGEGNYNKIRVEIE